MTAPPSLWTVRLDADRLADCAARLVAALASRDLTDREQTTLAETKRALRHHRRIVRGEAA